MSAFVIHWVDKGIPVTWFGQPTSHRRRRQQQRRKWELWKGVFHHDDFVCQWKGKQYLSEIPLIALNRPNNDSDRWGGRKGTTSKNSSKLSSIGGIFIGALFSSSTFYVAGNSLSFRVIWINSPHSVSVTITCRDVGLLLVTEYDSHK